MRIAIIENDKRSTELVTQTASENGHECKAYTRGHVFMKTVKTSSFDLVILPWNLPDISGIRLITWIRKNLNDSIFVMLLANKKMIEEKIVAAFMAGADGYITKPLHRSELLARIHSLSRRHHLYALGAQGINSHFFEIGKFRFDTVMRTAFIHGENIRLKPKEFDLAVLLFRNAGKVVNRDVISTLIWGRDLVENSRTIDTHISILRRKIGLRADNNALLKWVYKGGYRLDIF